MAPRALAGLRVVKIGGGLAAAYAGRLLADLGAEVVAVEGPSGDPLRRLGVTPDGNPQLGSALFRHLTADTASVTADLATADGRGVAHDLIGRADGSIGPVLVIDALGPGGLEGVDLDPSGLDADVAAVAVVRVAAAGQDGAAAARVATDLVLQAMGGWISDHGVPGSEPVRVGGRLASWVVGSYVAAAGLTAVRSAERRRTTVVADLSAQECLVGSLPYPMLLRRTLDEAGVPTTRRRYVVPGIVPCGDGWVGVNALTGQHWQDICVLFDTPQFDGRQQELLGDEAQYQAFLAAAAPWLADRSAEEIVALCQAFRIPAAPVGDGRSLPLLEHFAARSVYRRSSEGLRVPRPPHRWPDTGRPVERPGEESSTWPQPAVTGEGRPFEGLKVVDLTIFWAGPYVTMYLADMGADVVKIESPSRPDGFRFAATFPQLGEDWYERSLVWQATNLGKRSLGLDLRSPEGMDVLWSLIDEADVLIENFAPRVVEGFGLSADAVAARRPDLVYLRMPGFGLDGPWRDHVGWAMSYEQASGAAAVTGFAGGPPVNPGGFADPVVGMHATVALQAALVERDRTGLGGMVEIPQIEVLAAITAEQVLTADLTGEPPTRSGNTSDEAVIEVVLEAADGRWLALSVRGEREWRALVTVSGATSSLAEVGWSGVVDDPSSATPALRAWIATVDAATTADRLQAEGVPAAVVLDVAHMFDDPQLVHRGWYQELDHPVTGSAPYPGWPFRLRPGAPWFHDRPAPTIGQHNDEVLAALGLSADERERMRDEGVIGEGLVS